MKNAKIFDEILKLRQDYPILPESKLDEKFVYFDNAATMQKPRQVIDAISKYYRTRNANALRGMYPLSLQSTKLLDLARKTAARFIGCSDPSKIVFVRNTTEAINMAALDLKRKNANAKVLVDLISHHSNLLPFTERFKNTKIAFDVTTENISEYDLIALTGMSNVTGENRKALITEVRERSQGKILVDAAQLAAHDEINVEAMGADFLTFSGHKIGGPMGIGVLYIKDPEDFDPIYYGGEMVSSVEFDAGKVRPTLSEMPEKLEGGTVDVASAVGLMMAIMHLERFGTKKAFSYVSKLTEYARLRLSEVSDLNLYAADNGIITFNINGVHPHDTAEVLSQNGIMVRSGFHCAQPFLSDIGWGPVVRASLSWYNTPAEVDYFVTVLKKVRKEMGL